MGSSKAFQDKALWAIKRPNRGQETLLAPVCGVEGMHGPSSPRYPFIFPLSAGAGGRTSWLMGDSSGIWMKRTWRWFAVPFWYTVSSITRGTRRSRVSFGNWSHLPKMGRPRPSRTTQVRGGRAIPEKCKLGALPSLFLCWSMLLCFGGLLFLRYI